MYKKYSDEQLYRANHIDLVSFLMRRGERLKKCGVEYRWIYHDAEGEHDSITVRGFEWYDFKRAVGSKAIDFLRLNMGMTFQEAVDELLSGEVPEISYETVYKPKEEKLKKLKLPEKNCDMNRAYAYLTKCRHISPEVVRFFWNQGTLYEECEHHNVVFVGMNEKGEARHIHLKGTNSYGKNSFKINAVGSDPRFSFRYCGGGDSLYVFEAPVDLLSYITLHMSEWDKQNYVSLCGTSEHSIIYVLKMNPNIKTVYLCLDHDLGGYEANERITDILSEANVRINEIIPVYKDWNEDLKAHHGEKPIVGVDHPKPTLYNQAVNKIVYVPCRDIKKGATELWKNYKEQNYGQLALCAMSMAARAFEISHKITGFTKFQDIQKELICGYRAYKDKSFLKTKETELKRLVQNTLGLIWKEVSGTEEVMDNLHCNLRSIADLSIKIEIDALLTRSIVQENSYSDEMDQIKSMEPRIEIIQ